jgi:DnaK suppressor protein
LISELNGNSFIIRIPYLCAMAAKKNKPLPAPAKEPAKPAAKSKPAAVDGKAVSAKAENKASPDGSVSHKKTPPAKKPVAVDPVESKAAVVSKKAPAKAPAPAEPKVTQEAVKKTAPVKSRSSVVDFPAPPAPVKPPFVPPKAQPAPTGEPVAPGSNGTHSPAFIQKQRQRLLDLRDDLVDAVSGMARDTIRNAPEGSEASGSGQHQGDAGSDAYDRDFALSVLAKEQDALYEIEQALRRIQAGSYGICEISTRKIPQARLEAIPFARLTVECQAQWEKEYGNRRFRPSNEVGFSGGKYVDDEDSETVSLDEDDD